MATKPNPFAKGKKPAPGKPGDKAPAGKGKFVPFKKGGKK